MNDTKLRWGILGAAEIARKNWKAIGLSGNSIVTAVASRDLDKSRGFIAQCQADSPFDSVPEAFGTYEDLLASNEVDSVYIPLPTGLRKEWVLRAASAGKHIVCEKPCAASVADLEEMLETCRRNHVQFMDGVMFMHSLRLQKLREILGDGETVGQIKRITSAFSFCAPSEFLTSNIRMHSDLEPLGCLGDLGWYCIRLALWVMNWRMPRRVTGCILSQGGRPDSPAPVPLEFSGELLFEDGVSSGIYCSFITGLQQWANISGTRGYLQVSDFVMPFAGNELAVETQNAVFQITGCDFRMESHPRRITVAEHSHGHPDAQETNLFRTFADQVRTGRMNATWPEMALKTQQVLCACLESARASSRPIDLA